MRKPKVSTDRGRIPDRQAMMALLGQAFEMASGTPHLVRIGIPIARMDPLIWLQAQETPSKIYWLDREGAFEMAGIGSADTIADEGTRSYNQLFVRMTNGLSCAHPSLRYYGGLCFDATRLTDSRWRRFGAYRFIIPRFEILNANGGTYFVCNARHRGGSEDYDELDLIRGELKEIRSAESQTEAEIPAALSREDRPDRKGWSERVEEALRGFEEGALEKVVLAREARFRFARPLDPVDLARRLGANRYAAYLFCFQLEPGTAFVGASPERLCKRVGGYVQSEALAGTRPRGATNETDWQLGEALLHDDKERREHRFVVEGIRAALAPLCKEMRAERDASLVRLRDCQHLVSHFEGLLMDGKSDGDVLEALHPTAAVGGSPTDCALQWIQAAEPFDRGWYAGPVGWVGYDSSEFAVAIRSALIDGDTLSLYSGAGIVPGSTPDQEWNEIENKVNIFLNILTPHAE